MAASPVRRALLLCQDEVNADFARSLQRAGWDATAADNFGHARFLLSMTAFDGVVIAPRPGDPPVLDGLAWISDLSPAPPVLLAPPSEEVIAAVREGAIWLPPDAAFSSPALLGAALDQAEAVGRQRRSAEQLALALAECGGRVERLLGMLWEAAAPPPPPRWHTQRHILERLDEEVDRARRYGQPLAVVMGEVVAGGEMPADQADRLAGWMTAQVARGKRRSDVAGQYGRRGFLMLLPHTDGDRAQGACRRLRQALAEPPAGPRVRACLVVTPAEPTDNVPSLLRRAEVSLETARGGAL